MIFPPRFRLQMFIEFSYIFRAKFDEKSDEKSVLQLNSHLEATFSTLGSLFWPLGAISEDFGRPWGGLWGAFLGFLVCKNQSKF